MAFSTNVYQINDGNPAAPCYVLSWQDTSPTYLIRNFNVAAAHTITFKNNFKFSLAAYSAYVPASTDEDGNVTPASPAGIGGDGGLGGSWRIANTQTGAGMIVCLKQNAFTRYGDSNGNLPSRATTSNLYISKATSHTDNDGMGTVLATTSNLPMSDRDWYRMSITASISGGTMSVTAQLQNTSGSLIGSVSGSSAITVSNYMGFGTIGYGQPYGKGDHPTSFYVDDITVQAT